MPEKKLMFAYEITVPTLTEMKSQPPPRHSVFFVRNDTQFYSTHWKYSSQFYSLLMFC